MRIVQIDQAPLHTLSYRTAAPGGGVLHATFPLLRAAVDRLPAGCKALVICSDLQGLVDSPSTNGSVVSRLLGEALAEELALLSELGSIPPAAATGVLLCGDLYVRPALDARGGLGDVRPVWRAFAQHFRWVAGVPGNHDAFGSPAERAAFVSEPRMHLLDGAAVTLDGMHIAGLGGIIGGKDKPNRRDERTFLRELQALLAGRPELLLLHQGPDVPTRRFAGDPRVRQVLERAPETLVLCGHVHWTEILAELSPHVQVANLEGRGLVLLPADGATGV